MGARHDPLANRSDSVRAGAIDTDRSRLPTNHRPLDVTYSQARALQMASAGDVITECDTVRHDNGNFEYLPAIPDGWK